MKKIIIISWLPITKWDLKKFGLDNLKKNFELIFIEIFGVFFKNIKINNFYEKNNIISQLSLSSLKKLLKENKINSKLIINLCSHGFSTYLLTKFGKKNKIINFIDIRNMYFHIYPYKIFYYFRYLIKKIINLGNYNHNIVNIISGNSYTNLNISLGSSKIYGHSLNYDYFLRKKNSIKKIKSEKKAVCYIDSGFFYHIDYAIYTKNKDKFKILDYTNKLNNFFLYLAKKGYIVYFLAHPKIKKEKQLNYKYCKIIYEKTLEYIKRSSFVITTNSSTIDYAIILKKKILRLYSKNFKDYPILNHEYKMMSNFFSNEGLDLDCFKNDNKISKYIIRPSIKYLEYKNKFIKHPNSKNKLFSEIISDYIS